MKIKTIKVGMSHTIFIGDFQTIKPSIEIEAEIGEQEDVDSSIALLHSKVKEGFLDEIERNIGMLQRRDSRMYKYLQVWVRDERKHDESMKELDKLLKEKYHE